MHWENCCVNLFNKKKGLTSTSLDPRQKKGIGWHFETSLSSPVKTILTVPKRCFFFVMSVSVMLSCLFIGALWSPVEKGLTPWLYCV